jgi:hypothetical protein
MIKSLIIGGVLTGVLGVASWASLAGVGVPEPKPEQRDANSVRHGSVRRGRGYHRTFLFVGAGRRHGHYGGK